jgi:hypothetical protein
LKKRNKKLLLIGVRMPHGGPQGAKVFCFFFSKKKSFFVGTVSDHAPRTTGKSIAATARAASSGGGL